MEKLIRLSADVRENFVAYLDGELEDGATQQIDTILVQNEVARHEVESLARTWELLDILPPTKASENFSAKTIATVQLDQVPKLRPWLESMASQVKFWLVMAAGTAAVIVAGIVGFLATSRWTPNASERMLKELPMYREFDQLEDVDSLEFLKELRASGLFDDHASTGANRGN